MAKADLYSPNGTKAGNIDLNDAHFGVPAKMSLVHEAVMAQSRNRRQVLAHTKTRGEVRGGGKKPWKQKGTGRARHGSIRSPIWVGGGITFGPRSNRNFSVKINRKAKQKALFMALSNKLAHDNLIVLDSWKPEVAKTKALVDVMKSLPVKKSALFVLAAPDADKIRMAQNIDNVWVTTSNSLNVIDVLRYGTIVFEKDAIATFEQIFQKSAQEK